MKKLWKKIIFAFISDNRKTKRVSEPLKHYTFLIKTEGENQHVNIVAPDQASAEQKVKTEFPQHKATFLWEYIRNAV